MAWVRMTGSGNAKKNYIHIQLAPKGFGGVVDNYLRLYENTDGEDTRLIQEYIVSSAGPTTVTTEYITERYGSFDFKYKILYPYYKDAIGGTLYPADTSERTRSGSNTTPPQDFYVPLN